MRRTRGTESRTCSLFLAAAALLLVPGTTPAQDKVVELEFAHPPAAASDAARTLASLVKVRDIGEQYATGGLYLMTQFGDRQELFRKENQRAIEHPLIDQLWRACSVFSTKSGDSIVMGRNWDNQNVGSIIVSLYHPPRGYASISFTKAIDMGFPLNVDLEGIASSPLGERLLAAPFFAYDGINEHGLAVAVAGVRQVTHEPRPGKQRVFDPYLLRKMLDGAKTVEDAVTLAEGTIPFDVDENSLNAHFYVVDATGRSVVLEYEGGQWRNTYGKGSWQALTNKPVYGMPDATLRKQCWRYDTIAEALGKAGGSVDWQSGLKILQDVAQKGTTWSAVYSPTARDVFFSVYQSWDVVYHLQPFE